jgi:hypothetical protein
MLPYFFSNMLCPIHLISCIANMPMLYSCICSIRYFTAPLRYKVRIFQVPIRKPLYLLFRLQFIHPALIIWGFSTILFLRCEFVSLTPNPHPGGPGYFSLSGPYPYCPVRLGRPYRLLGYRRHSSQGYQDTQAPPPHQGGNTFGGVMKTCSFYFQIVI